MSAEKPRRLGRGLEALISGAASDPGAPEGELHRIQMSRIRPNPYQPRREFDPAELAELEASLKSSGLLQPIVVRRRGDAFEMIAGERRLRAATSLGWTEISAVVRDFDDRTMLVLALVENLQRANLNAIEEARGYRRLIDDFKLTQQQVAEAVGKDRTTVTNLLRVLSLPEPVQRLVEQGMLSPGHARALLALGPEHSAADFANDAVALGMSVRELEQRVRDASGAVPPASDSKSKARRSEPYAQSSADPAVRRVEDDLRRYLQTDVRIHVLANEKGRIDLSFYSSDDLERLLDLILRENRKDF
jgi:ParB family transcriptional regulator, chromosome partitioning protein